MRQSFEGKTGFLDYVVVLVIAGFILWAFLVYAPQIQTADLKSESPKVLFDAKNEARRTLAQILGGIIILVGVFLTWRRVRAAEDNVKVLQENQRILQEGQITERFTQAVEQLGSERVEIRLGGIYALERIAKDSPRDHWVIMELLTAYVRERAPWKMPEQDGGETPREKREGSKASDQAERKLSVDVQAVLTVIGRRNLSLEDENTPRLRLSSTDLQGAEFFEAHLEGANFQRVNLRKAYLGHAHLEGALFWKANLEGASLGEASLEKADLEAACLSEAWLVGARLGNSNLREADLRNARLREAFLKSANLEGANLEGANLEGANLEGVNLQGLNLEGADLEGAILKGADLMRANLQGARLKQANLEGANLIKANLQAPFNEHVDYYRGEMSVEDSYEGIHENTYEESEPSEHESEKEADSRLRALREEELHEFVSGFGRGIGRRKGEAYLDPPQRGIARM